tara:strand:- start:3136 stop:3978 length:843 start_codon:yes stop_codon:yes gene_type:complete
LKYLKSDMKVALCLHGYMSNARGLDSFVAGHKYICKKILEGNDVDIFVHCWEPQQKNLYDSYYGGRTIISDFEKQKDFKNFDICKNQSWFDEDINRASCPWPTNTIERTLSFLYSRKQTIYLKNSYEKEKGFEYDCTVLSRFDLGNRGKEYPQKYYATNFNLDKSSDMNALHCAYWDQFNHGLPDHWFYSNSSIMTKIADLYKDVSMYYKKDSGYVESCLNGWIDSNLNDQFSNECLKQNKTKNLLKWNRWQCIDNHKLYKWHIHQHDIPLTLVDITKNL